MADYSGSIKLIIEKLEENNNTTEVETLKNIINDYERQIHKHKIVSYKDTMSNQEMLNELEIFEEKIRKSYE